MKILWLARHAHSAAAEQAGVRDFDRPLSERGRLDVPGIASRLKERGETLPERILCSPARRTTETALLFASQFGLGEADVRFDSQIYLTSHTRLLQICRQLDDACRSVMLVGHNPAVTDLLNELCDNVSVDNIPSGGVACLAFDVTDWGGLAPGLAALKGFDYPSLYD